MRVWVYEKKGWPCLAYEDEREVYRGRTLVAVFDSLEVALRAVEAMLKNARAAGRRAGQAAAHLKI